MHDDDVATACCSGAKLAEAEAVGMSWEIDTEYLEAQRKRRDEYIAKLDAQSKERRARYDATRKPSNDSSILLGVGFAIGATLFD